MPPLPEGTRYRWKTYPKSGKKVRLAFAKGSNKVIEAKSRASVLGKKAHERGLK
jgi:hypothetical protein